MDPELDDIKKILIKRENMFAQEMKNKNAERFNQKFDIFRHH
jgi:hypothetical protein